MRVCVIMLILYLLSCPVSGQQNLRAWHIHGQTFIVWEYDFQDIGDTTTFSIYADNSPITTIQGLHRIERVFASSGANTRLNDLVSGARWRIPAASGELVSVGSNDVLGVITPSESGTTYYAVALTGQTTFAATGPVAESQDSVRAYVQYQDDRVTVYGHWIDGRADHTDGRVDYPVMGSVSCNGLGFNFALWNPDEVPIPDEIPLVVALHGYGGGIMSCAPTEPFGFYTETSSAYVATFDDALPEQILGVILEVGTFWFGWSTDFDRFDPELPGPDAMVVDYTGRRLWWEIDWLSAHRRVDQERISLMGVSMGGFGTLLHSQTRPERISAGLAFVPVFDVAALPAAPIYLFGTSIQNLPTSLPGNPGIYDISNQTWRLTNLEDGWPYTMIVCGRNDEVVGWEEKPETYRHLDSGATGFGLYWDQRYHADWIGYHWDASEHLHANYLIQFRNDRSFPAFFGTDLDCETDGRQPDPGNGEQDDGDPWGTWGGYLEWENGEISDEPDRWAVTFRIITESVYPNDITSADSILTSITIRNAQFFHPGNEDIYWEVVRCSDGRIIQSGFDQAVDDRVSISGLIARKENLRLSVQTGTSVEDGNPANSTESCLDVYPVPATGSCTASYGLQGTTWVRLDMYDLSGRNIRSLVVGNQTAGSHRIHVPLMTDDGSLCAPGVYMLRLESDGTHLSAETVIVR